MKTQVHKKLTARTIFAKNMRTVRRIKDISQEHLAFDAGISRAYIGDIERGNRSVSIDVMECIANALNVPLADLLKEQLIYTDYL